MLKRGGDKKRAQICRRPLWVTPLPSRFQNPNLTGATRLMGPTRLTDTICKVNNTITCYIIITVHVNFGMWETQQVFSSLFLDLTSKNSKTMNMPDLVDNHKFDRNDL